MDEFENGVPVTAETEATATATAQAQTPAKNEDVEQVVNRLLETRLATEVERRVQSELQKRKNRADKELAEDKRAIERMKRRGLLDEEAEKAQLAAAERDADAARAVWHYEEETPAANTFQNTTFQQVPQQQQRQTTEPSSQRQSNPDAEFRAFVQDVYGFDPKEHELEYSDVLGIKDANDPRVREFQRKARAMGAELDKRRSNAESVKKGIDDYGHTGGLSTGSASPSRSRLEQATDRDEIMDIATDEEWDKMQRGRR